MGQISPTDEHRLIELKKEKLLIFRSPSLGKPHAEVGSSGGTSVSGEISQVRARGLKSSGGYFCGGKPGWEIESPWQNAASEDRIGGCGPYWP